MIPRNKLREVPSDIFMDEPSENVNKRLNPKLRQSLNEGDAIEDSSHEVGVKRRGDQITDYNIQTFFWLFMIPVIVFIILVVLQPSYISFKTGTTELDYQSLLLWTLIISLIIWILFWGFAKCRHC